MNHNSRHGDSLDSLDSSYPAGIDRLICEAIWNYSKRRKDAVSWGGKKKEEISR